MTDFTPRFHANLPTKSLGPIRLEVPLELIAFKDLDGKINFAAVSPDDNFVGRSFDTVGALFENLKGYITNIDSTITPVINVGNPFAVSYAVLESE